MSVLVLHPMPVESGAGLPGEDGSAGMKVLSEEQNGRINGRGYAVPEILEPGGDGAGTFERFSSQPHVER